jgi:ABC-type Fe3+-hydroxamate transport system substrate-binding protein
MERATLIDAIGIQHSPVTAPARIVSLAPSITELLFALGLGDQVVGRTHYCIHPALAVAALPSVGGTKKIRHSRLRALRPTHVILNIDENPEGAGGTTGRVRAANHRDPSVDPRRQCAALSLARRHLQPRGRGGNAGGRIRAGAGGYGKLRGSKRQVLYLIWRKPWMSVSRDTYIARMLALVGWETLPAESEARYPVLALDRALLDAADLILFSSEPYRFQAADLDAFARDYDCRWRSCG